MRTQVEAKVEEIELATFMQAQHVHANLRANLRLVLGTKMLFAKTKEQLAELKAEELRAKEAALKE